MTSKQRVVLVVLFTALALGTLMSTARTDQMELGAQVGFQAMDFSLPVVGSWGEERANLYAEVVTHDLVLLFFFEQGT